MFCQLRVSGSLTVLWNPKLGSTHQFTSRGPLDQSGSCGVEQAIFYHTQEARLVILAIITVIPSEILVVVTGWKDVILTNENSVKWQPRLVSQNHIYNDDPRTVRVETG